MAVTSYDTKTYHIMDSVQQVSVNVEHIIGHGRALLTIKRFLTPGLTEKVELRPTREGLIELRELLNVAIVEWK